MIIPEGSRVLELGCGDGRLLAALRPSVGVGLDFAPAAIAKARKQYPELHFEVADVEQFELTETNFDYLILSDLINDLEDVQTLLLLLHPYCHSGTRLDLQLSTVGSGSFHCSWPSSWQGQPPAAAELVHGGRSPQPICTDQLRVAPATLRADPTAPFTRSEHCQSLPGTSTLLRHLCFTNLVVARPLQKSLPKQPSCSVVVAARNEEGHIEELLERFPWKALGPNPELIFVEGNSTDATYAKIQQNGSLISTT